MKVRRNDPCPCGSGKKYKKCCLQKERAMKEAEIRKERARRGYWDRFWKRFDAAGYREKISIFHKYLDSSNTAADVVFDMLSPLLEEARKRQDYKAFAGLVESVKTKRPEIYDKDASFYSWFLVENMALQGDFRDLLGALEPFASNPDSIDEFFRVIEILMYHSKTKPLLKVMQKGYPKVMGSHEILPPGKDEFSDLLGWFVIFENLEADPEELYSTISNYWDVDRAYLEGLVARLKGRLSSNWCREDFIKGSSRRGEAERKAFHLTIEFMHWLKEKGMNYTRALLARITLVEYLFDDEHYSKVKKGCFLLLPNKSILDRHLANYLNVFNNLPYRVAGLTEALPYYLEYLLHKGLIDEEEFKREIKGMKSLKEDVLNYFESSDSEKEILHAIEESWKRPSLRAICQ